MIFGIQSTSIFRIFQFLQITQNQFPLIYGNPLDGKIQIPLDLGESLKAQCQLTVYAGSAGSWQLPSGSQPLVYRQLAKSQRSLAQLKPISFFNFHELFLANQVLSDIVTTPTQPQLNSKVRCDMKMTLVHPPPPTQAQCKQYISCY